MNIRISIINYSNTIPFIFGLESSEYIKRNSTFFYHYPAQGVELLKNNTVDISIVPVATISEIPNASIVSDFCIGTQKTVASVKLFSKAPIHAISHIVLDYQSRTSNLLTQLLSEEYWKISPIFSIGKIGYENDSSIESKVIIGDRALINYKHYPYSYDLAEEWNKAYSLPFVFACWIANKSIPIDYLNEFNKALEYGINNIDESIDYCKKDVSFDLRNYLHHNINFYLDTEKRQAMNLFLQKTLQKI